MPQAVTLPSDTVQLAPAGPKTYVLDTNVLLHDPTAVTAFAEHRVVIPMTVLEELDHIKDRRDKSVSREARVDSVFPRHRRARRPRYPSDPRP